MLGSAHGAELGLLVVVSGQGLIVILLGPLRIQGELELPVPVEGVAGAAEFVVAIAGPGTVAGNVGGMGGDLVGDQSLSHILCVGQAQVLFGVT